MMGLIDSCQALLRRQDIRQEIKKALAPVVSLAADHLFPYVQICVLLVLGTFILQAGTFLMVLRATRASDASKTFSHASV